MQKTFVALACVAFTAALAGQQPEIAASVSFTEGPTVDRDGNVYFTEIVQQRIMKLGAGWRALDLSREEQRRQRPPDRSSGPARWRVKVANSSGQA